MTQDVAGPTALHSDTIVIDGTCPATHWRQHLDSWFAGGATCCVISVGAPLSPAGALYDLAGTYSFIEEHDRLTLATSVADIRAAKSRGMLSVVLQFQGTEPIEYEPALIGAYARLGVRTVQLAYNRRGPVCDGCEEPNDSGLSRLGRRVVEELNRRAVVVDVSHTGVKSSLETVALSTAPVVASHSNARGVRDHPRNLTDDVIRAIAESGGVIGINGFPPFVSGAERPSLDEFIDHMVYIGDLVGMSHVGLGIDYWNGTAADYKRQIDEGLWLEQDYPPPPWHFPSGLDDASGLPKLTGRLLERGFGLEDVQGILGENWLRVWDEVWRRGHGAADAEVLNGA